MPGGGPEAWGSRGPVPGGECEPPTPAEVRQAAESASQSDLRDGPHSWRLRNRSCEPVVVPAVTRVMHFSLAGGPNLLWEALELAGKTFPSDDGAWHNVGGEKLWPTQQKDLFKKYTGHDQWPPPWPWDAGASRAEPIADGVRLVLPHDKRFGARAVREFTLDRAEPLVRVRQWIEKTEGEPAEMTVWTVCQVSNPALSLLPCADGKFADFGTRSDLIVAGDGAVTLGRDETKGLKIGVAPAPAGRNGWVASVFPRPADGPGGGSAGGPGGGEVMFVQSHKLADGARYPDEGLQAELYTSPKSFAFYTEMELLGPLAAVKAGERLEDDAVWQVVPVSGKEYLQTARRAHERALERLK